MTQAQQNTPSRTGRGSFLDSLVHSPRKLFLRRALFQIHLWVGLFLALYVIVIALTGSILVFEDEFTATTLPAGLHPYDPAHTASIPTVMSVFLRTCSSCVVTDLTTPSPAVPAYRLLAKGLDQHEVNVVADPVTAAVYFQSRTWVDWVHDLHVTLLFGNAYGYQVNGVGAVLLVMLAITGITLWWQGLKIWSRGLALSFAHNWRRINYDAHNAIGFWTLLIVSWWGISGIYFSWYRQVVAAVNLVSPLSGMNAPDLPRLTPDPSTRASLESIVAAAHDASPHGRLFGLSDPSLTTPIVYARMDLRAPGDFSHRDIVTIDTRTARPLTIWHYGQNHSLGDWFIWSMHPLHFGTLWELPFKIVWCLLGIGLATLSITGILMYWNRYLRHIAGATFTTPESPVPAA
jgi:uncharacterized iron-regulated membrane protein